MVTEWLQTRASSRCGTVYFVFGFGSGVLARLILDVAECLMWSLRVVVGHPLIERLLCRLQIPEHLPGVELDSEGAVEALDLAGGGRRGRLGEDVVDAILPADAVELHLDRRLSVSASEDLSVVGQDLLRDSIAPER